MTAKKATREKSARRSQSANAAQVPNIFILGGGMSALTAAFELTSQPGWQERYCVTVYQMGWRLGGKGASSRNAEAWDRIEEHGLHLFFGFYENACRLLRDCYDELNRPKGHKMRDFGAAFAPHKTAEFAEEVGDRWRWWRQERFLTLEGEPGTSGDLPSASDYIRLIVDLLADILEGWELSPLPRPAWSTLRSRLREDIERFADLVEQAMDGANFAKALNRALILAAINRASGEADRASADQEPPPDDDFDALGLYLHLALETSLDLFERLRTGLPGFARVLWLLRRFRWWLDHARLSPDMDDIKRRTYYAIDLGLACAIGLLNECILHGRSWEDFDHQDFRAWVQRYGASYETAHSPMVNALYGLAFAEHHEIAAGTMMYDILRLLFTSRGAIMWKMQAGMGETIFAPLYQVLDKRGVRFEFFHRIDRLELDASGKRISRIHMGRQVTVEEGKTYQPLRDVDGIPCWPGAHDYYDQLQEAAELKRRRPDLEDWWTTWPDADPHVTVDVGEGDRVILGISIGSFPEICAELIQANRDFANMVGHVGTVQTRAGQLWFDRATPELGWKPPPPILGNFAPPFDVWADMTHLIPLEHYPHPVPKSLGYICSGMPDDPNDPMPTKGGDPAYPARQRDRVFQDVLGWLEDHGGELWPGAARPGKKEALDWDSLTSPNGRVGAARLKEQFWWATVSPSERYTLSEPGTTKYRLAAERSGFDNLYLAGDYTYTSINAGCIEAATMSGMHVSQAICGRPATIVGDRRKK